MKLRNLTLFIFFTALSIAAQENKNPNILWITSEDNSASWIGCYGNKYAETPHIDQLAKEGFQYMNTYANAPVCAAQRSTWITGIMSLSMGTHNMRSFYKIPNEKIQYYPELLKDAGYYTANFKKMDYNIGGKKGEDVWDNPNPVDWSALKKNQPFFQVINLGNSHESKAFGEVDNTAHNPKDVELAKYHPDVPDVRKNYAKYFDAIHEMDSDVGAKLKKLKEFGLEENTIVIYVSDHGGVLPRSKRFLFANSLHCPLVVKIPEQFKSLYPEKKPGSKVDRLVSFVDMPKTWISVAGGHIPEVMQGNIFLGDGTEKEDEYSFAFRGRMDERIDNARALMDKKYLYIKNYMPYVPWMQHLTYLWGMKATQAWVKEVEEERANELQARFFKPKQWVEELYDMEQDPDCAVNLALEKKHQKRLKKMRTALHQKQLKYFDGGLLPETEMQRLAALYKTTVYDLIRNPKQFDFIGAIELADIAMEQDPKNLKILRTSLDSPNLEIRYWATIGCFLLEDSYAGDKMLNDESHEISAMASWLLIKTGDEAKGLQRLNKLIEERSYALLTIFNMAEWIGESGKKLMQSINKVDLKERFKNQHKYQIRMRNHLNEVHQ